MQNSTINDINDQIVFVHPKVKNKIDQQARGQISALRGEIPIKWQNERRLEYLENRINFLIPKKESPLWLRQLKREWMQPLIKKRKRIKAMLNGREMNGTITYKDIGQAKEHKITEFIDVDERGKTNCPFHEDKTPSFQVYDDGGWHCFGCRKHGGDVIDFIMEFKKLRFPEAVKFLTGKE